MINILGTECFGGQWFTLQTSRPQLIRILWKAILLADQFALLKLQFPLEQGMLELAYLDNGDDIIDTVQSLRCSP